MAFQYIRDKITPALAGAEAFAKQAYQSVKYRCWSESSIASFLILVREMEENTGQLCNCKTFRYRDRESCKGTRWAGTATWGDRHSAELPVVSTQPRGAFQCMLPVAQPKHCTPASAHLPSGLGLKLQRHLSCGEDQRVSVAFCPPEDSSEAKETQRARSRASSEKHTFFLSPSLTYPPAPSTLLSESTSQISHSHPSQHLQFCFQGTLTQRGGHVLQCESAELGPGGNTERQRRVDQGLAGPAHLSSSCCLHRTWGQLPSICPGRSQTTQPSTLVCLENSSF